VQHGGGGHDGRLHDLPELRRLEVRLIAGVASRFPHALRPGFPPAAG